MSFQPPTLTEFVEDHSHTPSSRTRICPVHNLAYRLALLSSIAGLVLLTTAGSGDDVRTPLGVALLAAAGLLVGLGKALNVLGYVEEGATDAEEPQ